MVSFPFLSFPHKTGECLQIVTGGLLVATPHAVRASQAPKGVRVGRGTFPVFVDTGSLFFPPRSCLIVVSELPLFFSFSSGMDFPLSAPKGISREQVFDKTVESRVPPLADRWTRDGVPFVDFLGDTFKQYYTWATKNKK
jgi:hypothetical protein